MLSHYLDKALNDLEQLTQLTQTDIDDIKLAKHEVIFDRSKIKEELISSFQNKKAMIDNEISKLMEAYPDLGIDNLLSAEDQDKLSALKEHLVELKSLNKRYAKLVLTVSEFYNSLLERMVPTEMEGYEKVAQKHRSILEVRA
jgi:hypothetical protein